MSDPFRTPKRLQPPIIVPIENRPIRFLFYLHKYPPVHNAGAEWMAHSIAKFLQKQGHQVLVAIRDTEATDFYTFDGIRVKPAQKDMALEDPFTWCDIAITHLDVTKHAVIWAQKTRKPLVHLIHNHNQVAFWKLNPQKAQLLIWNSQWTADLHQDWNGPTFLLNPPVFAKDYQTSHGNRITLMNLHENKGSPLFWELARRMPDHDFLAVKGAYGFQEIPSVVPRNVRVLENTPKAKSVYSQTSILLMPSAYESWGRTAIEAFASGIPVIAHPTPGLLESLDYAGLFIERDQIQKWQEMILSLDDRKFYSERASLARQRSRDLDPMKQLLELESIFLKMLGVESSRG